MKQVLLLLQICLCCVSPCFCQDADTLETKRLDEVLIRGQKEINIERLPDIEGTRIWSGKKNEVINVRNLDANIAEKNGAPDFC